MNIESLKPHKGHLPKDFNAAVRLLKRPYTAITENQFVELRDTLEIAKTDFFIDDNGNVVTIGAADGGYAVMPLINNNLKQG